MDPGRSRGPACASSAAASGPRRRRSRSRTPPGQGRAGRRLDRPNHRRDPTGEFLPQEREGQAGEVEPPPVHPTITSGPASPTMRDCSMASSPIIVWCMQHVVEHPPQRVPGVGGPAPRPRPPRGSRYRGSPGPSGSSATPRAVPPRSPATASGARSRRRPPSASPGLPIVRGADLPHLALEPILGRRTPAPPPLPGPGLGGHPFRALDRVVVRLRHSGVRLVRPGGRASFVLVVDPGGRPQPLLQPAGSEQRGRPPQPVDVPDLAGMSTYRSALTSCRISSIGNSGARSSGPTGCRCPGAAAVAAARAGRARRCTTGSVSPTRRGSTWCARSRGPPGWLSALASALCPPHGQAL